MKNHWINKRNKDAQRDARLVQIATDNGFNFAWVLDLVDTQHAWHHVAITSNKNVYIDGRLIQEE